MKKIMWLFAISLLFGASAAVAGVIEKAPDLGDYWQPLSPAPKGTYVYADSFVAPNSGLITELGLWLNGGGSNSVVKFQIYGSVGGNPALGPDTTNVLARTSVFSGLSFNALTFVDGVPLSGGVSLIGGNTYWFAASTVRLDGSGSFNVGGHTQNSGGIVDNGTFWYSNDPLGINYDGQRLTPEMAFKVTVDSGNVPEPATLVLMAFGLLGVVVTRRRINK